MAATRENVLAAIAQYVQENKRRAPAHEITGMVGDSYPNVQAIIKTLVADGAINSSRGRNGGALPDGVTLDKKVAVKPAKTQATNTETVEESVIDPSVADQFAALMQQLESDSVGEEAAAV